MSALSDFNDMGAALGLAAVRRQIVDQAAPPPELEGPKEDRDGPSPLAPPRMAAEGFPPLLRDIVAAACASSEAHPVAVAANAMLLFCCAIGRGPFQRIGDAVIHARPFAIVVGKSAKARKGTAEITPREIARRADALLRKRHNNLDRLRIHAGGLSTGEGVAFAIRERAPFALMIEPDHITVESGKKAAQAVVALQSKVVKGLSESKGGQTADELAKTIGEDGEAETVWRICEHLAANGRARKEKGTTPFNGKYLS